MPCDRNIVKTAYQTFNIILLLLVSLIVSAEDKLTVYAVNYPLAYFAERIGEDHVKVVFPIPAGVDPAFWEPDANDIAGFQQADVVLLNGAGYAKWVKRASLPRRKLVNTSAAFQKDYISVTGTATHQHGPGGDHSHAGTAFTTWLDFNQAIQQAKAIQLSLEKRRPEYANVFKRNYAVLEKELDSLDKKIKTLVAREPDKLFMASHPVYQYFARRYQLNLKSVMWEPDVVPEGHQWSELRQLLRHHPAKWMIWEGAPDERSVTGLKETGINSLVFSPCANVPSEGDFMSVMSENMLQLEKAYIHNK